jgi:hypothetical protein
MPPTAPDEHFEQEARQRFAAGIVTPLSRIRQALGARGGDRWVVFYPRCLLGAAVFAGAVFHHQTGFWVDCEQGGELWDLNRQPGKLALPHLRVEVASQEDAPSEEVHLLISISRDVRDGYGGWLRQHPEAAPRHRVLVGHRDGPGPGALRAIEAVDWADAIRQHLAPLRTAPSAPLRIFCAAPAAFCVALGRSLNALGAVITMDLVKARGRYFASFIF